MTDPLDKAVFATPSPVIETEGSGVNCEQCKGSGEVSSGGLPKGRSCPTCSGAGYVAAERSTDREAVEIDDLTAALDKWVPEPDDRVVPLLLAQAARRDAKNWRDEDAENVIAFLLALALRPVGAENVRDNNALGAGKPEPAGGLRPEPVPVSALSGAHQAQGE